jgi:hypothetical protein
MISPAAFTETGRARPLQVLYVGDEFDFGTSDELTRMLAEGMIEAVPDGALEHAAP